MSVLHKPEMNGNAAAPVALTAGEDAVVSMLAKYLARAKKGEFKAVALCVATDPVKFAVDYSGAQGHDIALNMGLDILKASVIENFMAANLKPSQLVAPASSLVVPGRR